MTRCSSEKAVFSQLELTCLTTADDECGVNLGSNRQVTGFRIKDGNNPEKAITIKCSGGQISAARSACLEKTTPASHAAPRAIGIDSAMSFRESAGKSTHQLWRTCQRPCSATLMLTLRRAAGLALSQPPLVPGGHQGCVTVQGPVLFQWWPVQLIGQTFPNLPPEGHKAR